MTFEKNITMEENITEKLLNKILDLQEELAEEKQLNKNMEKQSIKYRRCIEYLNEENKKQERKTKDKEIYAFYIGIGFTIFFLLLKKILLWYFF